MHKLFMALAGVSLLAQAHALPCYITVAKDNCWTKYNVKIDVVDVTNQNVLASMSMPQGTSWARQEIVCQPEQTVMLKATFLPVIWEADAGRVYSGARYWSFPRQVENADADASVMSMSICFSGDFEEVSFPPDSSGHCSCDLKSIPAIKQP